MLKGLLVKYVWKCAFLGNTLEHLMKPFIIYSLFTATSFPFTLLIPACSQDDNDQDD